MKKAVQILLLAAWMSPLPATAENPISGAFKRLFGGGQTTEETASPAEGTASPAEAAVSAAPAPEVPVPAEADAALFVISLNGQKERLVIRLLPDVAPQTVENFKRNVAAGVYEGMAFHRVIRNYLVQTGDPLSRDDSQKELWGTTDTGGTVPAEFKGKHRRYSVAMAHKPGQGSSSSSQFYITLDAAGQLDGQYAVFGEVISGTDVLNRMSAAVVDTNDVPVRRIEIADAKLIQSDSKLAKGLDERGLKKSKPDSAKGPLEKFIERVW